MSEKHLFLKQIMWSCKENEICRFLDANAEPLESLVHEINKIPDVTVIRRSHSADSFWLQIGYKTQQSHTLFNKNFYIEGELKNVFKSIMKYTKENRLAFSMSALKADSLVFKGTTEGNFFRHYFYEIRKQPQAKFFAQTPANKKSFDYFDYILFLPQTVSMVIYYDYNHDTRYFQTFFQNYDQTIEAKIIADRALFKEYNFDRHQHNQENDILYSANGAYTGKNPLFFWPDENDYFEKAGAENKKNFPIHLFIGDE